MNLYFWNKRSLEMKKVPKTKSITIISLILALFVVLFRVAYKTGFDVGKKAEIMEKDVVILYQKAENSYFSRRNFYEYLKTINIKFPELVFAQAMKESGFKSPLWKNNNNPFGMKEASKRPNMQNGTQDGYAYYNTWKDAIIDYALYQSYVGLSKLKTENEYLDYLKAMNYYDTNHPNNENYLKDLKYIANNIEYYLKE